MCVVLCSLCIMKTICPGTDGGCWCSRWQVACCQRLVLLSYREQQLWVLIGTQKDFVGCWGRERWIEREADIQRERAWEIKWRNGRESQPGEESESVLKWNTSKTHQLAQHIPEKRKEVEWRDFFIFTPSPKKGVCTGEARNRDKNRCHVCFFYLFSYVFFSTCLMPHQSSLRLIPQHLSIWAWILNSRFGCFPRFPCRHLDEVEAETGTRELGWFQSDLLRPLQSLPPHRRSLERKRHCKWYWNVNLFRLYSAKAFFTFHVFPLHPQALWWTALFCKCMVKWWMAAIGLHREAWVMEWRRWQLLEPGKWNIRKIVHYFLSVLEW